MEDGTASSTRPDESAAPALAGTDPTSFPEPAQIPRGELAKRMGIVVTEATPERMVATMPVEGNRQPFGLLHGGASAVLAESVASIHATLLAGPGRVAVGVELSCTHHRAVTDGLVTAVCTPLHVGRTVSTFHIAIRDAAGRPTCTARLTCMSRSAEPTARESNGASQIGATAALGDTAR